MRNIGLAISKDYVEIVDVDTQYVIMKWDIDEVEENASVAFAMASAINLYHTDQAQLLEIIEAELGFVD